MLKHAKNEKQKDLLEAAVENILEFDSNIRKAEAAEIDEQTKEAIDAKEIVIQEVNGTVAEVSEEEIKEEAPKSEPEPEPTPKKPEPEQTNEETNKSNLGLWFDLELRKQIHITPKGWELRRG